MKLLYQSQYFRFTEDKQKRCYCFETPYKTVSLSFCQLLALRTKVRAMDLQAHFDVNRNKNGIEILCFCNREHLILLDTYQVIDLKRGIQAVFSYSRNTEIASTPL